MDSLITFEKLTAKHLPYLYEIRFSVEENLLHPHQIDARRADRPGKERIGVVEQRLEPCDGGFDGEFIHDIRGV